MKIQSFIKNNEKLIELVAENEEEPKLLSQIFCAEGGRYRISSFGYNRKMPKFSRKRSAADWAQILTDNSNKQVLSFKFHPFGES